MSEVQRELCSPRPFGIFYPKNGSIPYLEAMSPAVASLTEQMVPVLRRYDVRRAGVFGSYARGDVGPTSDLDLLVDLPPGSSLLDLVGLQLDLSEVLGIRVDAGTYDSLHPLVRERVLGEEIRVL